MEIDTITTIMAKSFGIGNYTKKDGTASFFVYCLAQDGHVYRLDDRAGGWYAVPMAVIQPMVNNMQADE